MRTLFIYIFLTICMANALQAQTYSSHKLAEIGELFPIACLPSADSIFQCSQVTKGKSFVVQYNKKNEIAHLGVSLFSPETKEMISVPVCNFIERIMLELLLQKSSVEVQSKLREYKISLSKNGVGYGSLFFSSLSQTLDDIQYPTQFALRKDSCYTVLWEFGDDRLTLSFPAFRELIFGTDKKESDASIGELFISDDCQEPLKINVPNAIPANELVLMKGTDLYKRKGSMFLSDKINSNTYYHRSDSLYQPVFSSDYPTESLSNLFITKQIENSLTLKITHKMYGGFTPEFTISLNRFSCLFGKEFSTYCVSYIPESGNVQLSVVLYNYNFNYIHLLRVKTTVEQLFRRDGIVSADFYTNIPLHNLKSILAIK